MRVPAEVETGLATVTVSAKAKFPVAPLRLQIPVLAEQTKE